METKECRCLETDRPTRPRKVFVQSTPDMDLLQTEILKMLECPTCSEHMRPPITLCENGHNVCNKCRLKIEYCPHCRKRFLNVRCLALEMICHKITFPCKYRSHGCEEKFPNDAIEEHQANCPHRLYECPFVIVKGLMCPWEGTLSDIKKHIPTSHFGHYSHFEGSTKIVLTILETCNAWWQALFSHKEIFFMYSVTTARRFYSCIMFVGPKSCASKFRYSITVEQNDKQGSFCRSHTICSYLEDIQNIFFHGRCFVIERSMLTKYLDEERRLRMDIHICKAESSDTASEAGVTSLKNETG